MIHIVYRYFAIYRNFVMNAWSPMEHISVLALTREPLRDGETARPTRSRLLKTVVHTLYCNVIVEIDQSQADAFKVRACGAKAPGARPPGV
jgi:hypothetical protein